MLFRFGIVAYLVAAVMDVIVALPGIVTEFALCGWLLLFSRRPTVSS